MFLSIGVWKNCILPMGNFLFHKNQKRLLEKNHWFTHFVSSLHLLAGLVLFCLLEHVSFTSLHPIPLKSFVHWHTPPPLLYRWWTQIPLHRSVHWLTPPFLLAVDVRWICAELDLLCISIWIPVFLNWSISLIHFQLVHSLKVLWHLQNHNDWTQWWWWRLEGFCTIP